MADLIALLICVCVAATYTESCICKVFYRDEWMRGAMNYCADKFNEPAEASRQACEIFLARSVPVDIMIAAASWFMVAVFLFEA